MLISYDNDINRNPSFISLQSIASINSIHIIWNHVELVHGLRSGILIIIVDCVVHFGMMVVYQLHRISSTIEKRVNGFVKCQVYCTFVDDSLFECYHFIVIKQMSIISSTKVIIARFCYSKL